MREKKKWMCRSKYWTAEKTWHWYVILCIKPAGFYFFSTNLVEKVLVAGKKKKKKKYNSWKKIPGISDPLMSHLSPQDFGMLCLMTFSQRSNIDIHNSHEFLILRQESVCFLNAVLCKKYSLSKWVKLFSHVWNKTARVEFFLSGFI